MSTKDAIFKMALLCLKILKTLSLAFLGQMVTSHKLRPFSDFRALCAKRVLIISHEKINSHFRRYYLNDWMIIYSSEFYEFVYFHEFLIFSWNSNNLCCIIYTNFSFIKLWYIKARIYKIMKFSFSFQDILKDINSRVAAKERHSRLLEIYNKLDPKHSITFNGRKFKKSDFFQPTVSGHDRKLMFEGKASMQVSRR